MIDFGPQLADCHDCSGGRCTMNCGPVATSRPAPALPADFRMICSVCGESLVAALHFSKGNYAFNSPF